MTRNETDYRCMARKTTQRALYTSMLSIVACAMMLFGATFAWFTMSTSSDASTLLAQDFDVTVKLDGEEITNLCGITETHTVKLTRTEGSAPGYCLLTLNYTGIYQQTSGTITYYTNGTEVENLTTTETVQDSGSRACYAVFDGTNESVTFTLSMNEAYIADIVINNVSWGEYNAGGGMRLRMRSVSGGADTPEMLIDGETVIDLVHADEDLSSIEYVQPNLTEMAEDEIAALLESGVITEEDVAALAPAADPKEEQNVGTGSAEPTDNTQTTMNGDNNDGENDNDNADTGTGNDGNGSGAGGSGSAGSGGGSGAGGGESESGAGGSGAGESESGSGESSSTDSGGSGSGTGPGDSGTDSGSSGDSGS